MRGSLHTLPLPPLLLLLLLPPPSAPAIAAVPSLALAPAPVRAGPKVGFVSGYYYTEIEGSLPFLEVPLAVDATFQIDRVGGWGWMSWVGAGQAVDLLDGD